MKKRLLFFATALVLLVGGAVSAEEVTPAQISEWREAAEQGDAEAQYELGEAYRFGQGVATDWSESVKWYRKAAEQGDTEAQYALGFLYFVGLGVAQDKREAVSWFRKAAEQGHADAQAVLGAAYWSGEGVAEDKREAVRWWRKAAEQGHADAQSALGVMYWFGEGVAQDKREGVRWFREAAEQGYAEAQYFLGGAYWLGEDVTEDKREAVKWYRKAAEQGYADAQYELGLAYRFGEGVAQDKREGVRWFREAAEQGGAGAQFRLGLAYWFGEGVAQDKREAVKWYRKAAEQGDAGAQGSLGAAYSLGEGVIEDIRESYIWLAIAKANGDEYAGKAFNEINWKAELSRAEIKDARREARVRMQDIQARQNEVGDATDLVTQFAAVPRADAAERVFDSAWRSIVYIRSDDGQGSGVIVGENRVATNCHVIEEGGVVVHPPQSREATSDSGLRARVVSRDSERDLCILRVFGMRGVNAKVRRFSTLRIGETVYAIGAPKGLDLSLSRGLISQLRKGEGVRMIQTDTAISPGSSGGGLFDANGNLVGIVTVKIVDEDVEGIGFAIPADLVLE